MARGTQAGSPIVVRLDAGALAKGLAVCVGAAHGSIVSAAVLAGYQAIGLAQRLAAHVLALWDWSGSRRRGHRRLARHSMRHDRLSTRAQPLVAICCSRSWSRGPAHRATLQRRFATYRTHRSSLRTWCSASESERARMARICITCSRWRFGIGCRPVPRQWLHCLSDKVGVPGIVW